MLLNIVKGSKKKTKRNEESRATKRKHPNDDSEVQRKRKRKPNTESISKEMRPKKSDNRTPNLKGPIVSTKKLMELKDALPNVNSSKITGIHDHKKFGREMFSREVKSFKELQLCDRLVSLLEENMKLKRPTYIQAKAIPVLLRGSDAMFKSKTGSGKTLAFLLPMVHMLQKRKRRFERSDGTIAMVISPTRELALQIFHVLTKVLKPFHWLVASTLMGGERRKSEKARLRKGVSIVVATPGRLLDHMKTTKSFKFLNTRFLVLDEADRLLDLGFEKDVKEIINILDGKKHPSISRRQSILTSATLSTSLATLIESALTDPVTIGMDSSAVNLSDNKQNTVAKAQEEEGLPKGLVQSYVLVDAKYRLTVLAAFLRALVVGGARKVIVFVGTCDSVEFHHQLFDSCTWPCNLNASQRSRFLNSPLLKLHGNIDQKDRTKTFFRFCNAKRGVLFCTDVAARGLDLPAVDYIVQYDPPENTSTYIHRVGRTARMGQKGKALLFLQRSESEYVDTLKEHSLNLNEISVISILSELNQEADEMEEDAEVEDSAVPPGLQLQSQFESLVESDIELSELARLSFLSSVRAYAAFPKAMKRFFHPKKLHLGLFARSFALKEQPRHIARKEVGNKMSKAQTSVNESRHRNPINRKFLKRQYGDDMRAAKRANEVKHPSVSPQQKEKGKPDHMKKSVKAIKRNFKNGKVRNERSDRRSKAKSYKFLKLDHTSEFAS